MHFWISEGPLGMGIVFDKSNLLLIGSYGDNSVIFCFWGKKYSSEIPPPQKKIIGVCEVNLYSKNGFKPFLLYQKTLLLLFIYFINHLKIN